MYAHERSLHIMLYKWENACLPEYSIHKRKTIRIIIRNKNNDKGTYISLSLSPFFFLPRMVQKEETNDTRSVLPLANKTEKLRQTEKKNAKRHIRNSLFLFAAPLSIMHVHCHCCCRIFCFCGSLAYFTYLTTKPEQTARAIHFIDQCGLVQFIIFFAIFLHAFLDAISICYRILSVILYIMHVISISQRYYGNLQ